MTWNKNAPLGSTAANQIDDHIRETRADIETALTAEGIFPGPTPSSPVYKWTGKRGVTSARPSTPQTGELYFNTEIGQIEYYSGSAWVGYDLVPARAITGGKIGLQAVTTEHLGIVVGPGMTGGQGTTIRPNTDGSTVEVNGANGQLRIVPAGITGTQLATGLNIPGNFTASTRTAFMAYVSADQDAITGDGTAVTVPFNTSVFDNGGNYNSSEYYFQAAVTGKYNLRARVNLGNTGSTNICELAFLTTGGNYGVEVAVPVNQCVEYSELVPMTANDTCIVKLTVSGGARLVGIKALTSITSYPRTSTFSGFLVG